MGGTAPVRDFFLSFSLFFSLARRRRHRPALAHLRPSTNGKRQKNTSIDHRRPLRRPARAVGVVAVLRLALAALVRHPQRRRDAAGSPAALLHNRRRPRRGDLASRVQEQLLHVAGRAGFCEFFFSWFLVLEVMVVVAFGVIKK